MAHGVNPMVKREIEIGNKQRSETVVDGHQVINPSRMGSRRMFTPQFKLQVLDSYRNDSDCKGNQRATARKYGIHRRQIQKWLQCETNLRSSVVNSCSKTGQSVNQNQTTNPKQANGEVNFHLSLDITRQSVALTSNKSNTGFLSPVHSHTLDYTPVSYEHISPSASLPSSPVFTAPIEQQQRQQQQQYDEYSVHFVDYVPQLQQQTPSTSIQTPTQHQHEQQFHENQIGFNYESYYYDISPMMPATPIDLSVSGRSREKFCKSRTPSPRACVWQNVVESCSQSTWQQSNSLSDDGTHFVELTNVCSTAMDLSCHKRKATDEKLDGSDEWSSKPAKAIKLFKPYLDDNDDDEDDDGKKCKGEQRDPIIWSNYCENYSTYSCSPHHFDCNSNIKESVYSYSSPPYPASTYICCSYGSPVSGYDSASSSYSTCSESGETKRSFDYTIDFKFQPIESYYGELSCGRGDVERAVPHKYCMEIAG